jgi:hypothetical protein
VLRRLFSTCKASSESQGGILYPVRYERVGTHIFLPSFAHITLITHAGLKGPCVIGIIFRKLRSKYMGKKMVDFNAKRGTKLIYFDLKIL